MELQMLEIPNNNMVSVEGTTDDAFRQLLSVISEWYDKRGSINMLKVLYRDHVENTAQLNKASGTMDLMNLLINSGDLHSTDLKLLYDTIKVTKQLGVERKIKDIMPSFPNVRDVRISTFTPHRQKVIKLGMALMDNEVVKISGLYNEPVKEYADAWSLIMDLEHRRKICEGNMEPFIAKLNTLELSLAVEVLTKNIPNELSKSDQGCGDGVPVKLTLKRKSETSIVSKDQPNEKRLLQSFNSHDEPQYHLLDLANELKKCIGNLPGNVNVEEINELSEISEKLANYFKGIKASLLKLGDGSIVFYLSLHDPRALMNLWEIHLSRELINDLAKILIPEKHQQEFLDEWTTCIDELEYKAAISKLMGKEMEMNQDLQRYSFHATWDLNRNLVKPFDLLMRQIDQHVKDETHETFLEEGLLFKSYLYMSGIGGNAKDNKNATKCLDDVITLLDKWCSSPEKDGFLSIAYALEAWIDMDKTESRLQDLKTLYSNNSHETQKRFEATIHYVKGFSLSRLGVKRYAECIDEFRQAKEKSPENHEYLFSFALMTRKFNGPDVREEVKEMLLKVLEKKNDYLYAKVELASLEYLNRNTVEATELLEEITTTLKAKQSITPENMSILGNVMKIYLQMEECDKAEETYNMACGFPQELHSYVIYERAILAKKRGQWRAYVHFLEDALENNPFKVNIQLQLAKQKLHKCNRTIDVKTEFDKMKKEYEFDEIAMIRILSDFGTMLMKIGDQTNAVIAYSAAMNKAFESCQRNPDEKSQRIKFYNEVNFAVTICITKLRDYWTNNIQNPEVICKLADFEYKLRNLHLTRSYCNEALKKALDEKQKYEIVCILAEIEIELANDVNTLVEVDEMLKTITPSAQYNQKLLEIRGKLAYKNGILQERLHHSVPLNEYATAAKFGHVEAVKRLLLALEITDKTSTKFYEMCAFIDMLLKSIQVVAERDSMRERLRIVLETAISRDLKPLREQQFEMEQALLCQTGSPVYNAATVIQTSRNLLNSAMNKLTQRYRQPKGYAEKTIDFFCIHRNFDKQQTEVKVRSKLKQYKWEKIDDELIKFLVEIQPCTNPQANNWIMAFLEFNNTEKHQRQNRQYGKYKVYPEDQGAQPGVYQDKEYYSVDLARTVCNNIPYILDNLNGFSLKF